jgi:uncharacterized SAM-dependent methyltransferase
MLFDQICKLKEYHPTRVETQIMLRSAEEMAERMGPNIRLMEYGSGSSVKTRKLLDNLVDIHYYLPVDISGDHLQRIAQGLRTEYSHKYSIDGFASLAAEAGWTRREVWNDWRNYFAVTYLE